MMPIPLTLFLDFDGVTHPDPFLHHQVFSQLPLIEDVLFDFPTVQIVISSSWREHYSLDHMREFFSRSIAPRLIGVTPLLTQPAAGWPLSGRDECEREWEIRRWLREHGQHDARWLAIDDQPQWFTPDCQDLLVTDCSIGFQEEHQPLLRQMIRERM